MNAGVSGVFKYESDGIFGFQGEYRWLSNFWPCLVLFDGDEYPSTENAYQAAKVPKQQRAIFKTISPGKAKRLARSFKPQDFNKVEVMQDLLFQKFCQSPFKEKLLATGDCYIEETNTWNDTFWGVCNGVGQNKLGQLIMEIREELKNV